MPAWWLSPAEFDALRLSVQVSLCAVAIDILPAACIAYLLARRNFLGKKVLEVGVDLPLVLPPVVTGFLLLILFSPRGAIGGLLDDWFGVRIVFHWWGAALASGVVGFPLMVRGMRVAFAAVDPRLEQAARSLGAGPLDVVWNITLPLARRGVSAGCLLAFARSLGEFGATIMVAGNIPGETQTIPLAVYSLVNSPDGWSASWRLVLLSILLSCVALGAGEFLERKEGPRET